MSMQSDSTPDWPQQATETIVGLVDNVKHKTTQPATKAVRAIVYGIVILILGVPAVIMLLIGIVHLFSQAVSSVGLGVWLVYLVLGAILTVAGLILWRKRVE